MNCGTCQGCPDCCGDQTPENCDHLSYFGEPFPECCFGPRDVVITDCGNRNCVCDRCRHGGFRCFGECREKSEPVSCETFSLIACIGDCQDEITGSEAILTRHCGAVHRIPLLPVVNGECGKCDSTVLAGEVPSDSLEPGWWFASAKLTIGGNVRFGEKATFRLGKCPEPDEPTADDCDTDCQSGPDC